MTRRKAVDVSVDAMIEDLRTLVGVESPSRDLTALSASAGAVAAVIESRLGGRAVLVASEAGPHVHWSAARQLLPGLEGRAVGGGSDGNFTPSGRNWSPAW